MKLAILILPLVTALLTACGSPEEQSANDVNSQVLYQVSGEASWYGPGFHGNYTSNGEVYNQYALTAAHKTLPFGTRVRVTNLYNGRSVVVRINDRGPFTPGRIIDLSQGAAQVIGITSSGVAPVRLDVFGVGPIETPEQACAKSGFTVKDGKLNVSVPANCPATKISVQRLTSGAWPVGHPTVHIWPDKKSHHLNVPLQKIFGNSKEGRYLRVSLMKNEKTYFTSNPSPQVPESEKSKW